MRIGLIAPQDNGKTSYLAALYAVLVVDRSSEKGYPLRFSVDSPIQRRWFDDRFSNLIDEDLPRQNKEDPDRQRFPRKTSDDVTEYVFSIRERSTSFEQKVTLIDFPGGTIRGVASEGSIDVHANMVRQLTTCDAFVVLLDAEALLSRKRYKAQTHLTPSSIEEIILKAIEGSGSRQYSKVGVPIAFCMSMADKVSSLYGGDVEALETGYERVLELFPSFFEPRYKHPVLITAVSLGETIDVPPDGEPEKGGPFEPYLVEKPFEFCLAFGALSAMTGSSEDQHKWKSTADREDERRRRALDRGFWGTIGEWLSTDARFGQTPAEYWEEQRDISRKIAERHRNAATDFSNVISLFLKHLGNPESASRYSIYYGGALHDITSDIRPGVLPLTPAV